MASDEAKAVAYDDTSRRLDEAQEYARQIGALALGRNVWHAILDDAIRLRTERDAALDAAERPPSGGTGWPNAPTDATAIVTELERRLADAKKRGGFVALTHEMANQVIGGLRPTPGRAVLEGTGGEVDGWVMCQGCDGTGGPSFSCAGCGGDGYVRKRQAEGRGDGNGER